MATTSILCKGVPLVVNFQKRRIQHSQVQICAPLNICSSSICRLPFAGCRCSRSEFHPFHRNVGLDGAPFSLNQGFHPFILTGRSTKTYVRSRGMVLKAGLRFDPGGGGGKDGDGNGIGRFIVNLALAGGLTYLTLTGKLGWVFDTIISLWLLAVLLPIVGVIAFLWFAGREIVTGAICCKEQPQACPYCSQPFKLENRRFIREEPRFSGQYTNSGPFSAGFKSPFGSGFGQDSRTSPRKESTEDAGGVIVDVEAEVRDKD